MLEEITKIMKIIKEIAYYEALAKIHRRAARNAAIGMHKNNIARAHQLAAMNKYNTQRLLVHNKQMSLWRNRNRTYK